MGRVARAARARGEGTGKPANGRQNWFHPCKAQPHCICQGDLYKAAASLGDDLKFLFIVSNIEIAPAAEEKIEVGIAEGEKCERCWHVRSDTGANPEHPGICGRCVSNLFGQGEVRDHV